MKTQAQIDSIVNHFLEASLNRPHAERIVMRDVGAAQLRLMLDAFYNKPDHSYQDTFSHMFQTQTKIIALMLGISSSHMTDEQMDREVISELSVVFGELLRYEIMRVRREMETNKNG